MAEGRLMTDDARLLARFKDVLGLSEREIAEKVLGCKRELVSAYLNGRARLGLSAVERERISALCQRARKQLAMIEMEL